MIGALSLVGAVLVLSPTTGASALAPRSYYYESRASGTVDGRAQSSSMRMWVKTPTVARIEQAAGRKRLVTIVRGTDAWAFDPVAGKGVHQALDSRRSIALQKQLGSPSAPASAFIAQGARRSGRDRIDGAVCDRYVLQTGDGITTTLWLLPGPDRLRRRVLSAGTTRTALGIGQPMKAHSRRIVVDYLGWQVGKPMSDTLFRVPAGVKIAEAPRSQALPPGHPGMPGAPGMPPGHPAVGGMPGRVR